LTIYPKPQAQFSILTQDSCGPRWVKFTNTSNAKNSEPMSSMSYLWTNLGTNRTSTNDSGFYVNSAINDSSYTVRLISTSMHGCKDTVAKDVVVYPNAKAVYTRLIGTACAPFYISPSNINAQPFANANSSYEWYKNGVFIGSGINFPGTSITNQSDSAVIKLKAISLKACKNDSMEMWFYTIENPKPRFIAIDSITCSGTNIQFTNLSTPNTGLTYRWEFGSATNTSSSKNAFYTFYNYSDLDTLVIVKLFTIAGGTGCIDSISKTLIIKPLPNPIFTLSDTILCFPKVLFTTNSSAQIPPINNTSYKWFVRPTGASIFNDTSNSQTSISFADNQSGTNNFYTITLRSESNFGCIDSTQKQIRIPSRPKAIFTFNVDSACGPLNITGSNQSLYSNTFQWSSVKTGPTIISPSSFNTNILFPSHTGLIDSIYPIKLIATNTDGCTDTLLKPFKIFPKPVTRFATSLDSGCAPLPIDFFDQSIIRKPAVYQWSFGDGVNLNTGLDTVIHTYFGSIYRDTTYTSRLISISANGCKDTLTKSINVLSGAVANIHLDDTLICSNAGNPTKLKITNNSFGSVDTFYWDFGDGNNLITTRDTSIFKAYPFEGSYSIILKAVNSCRTSYDTAVVTVQVPPNVNFTKSDSVGCNPLVVNFTNLSTNTYKASFLWNYGNGNSSTNYIPTEQTYLQSLTTDTFYYIKLTVSNFCGSFPKLDTVRVIPKPTAIFLTNTNIGCSPLEIYLSNFSVGLPQNVKWYFGNGDSSIRYNLDYPFKPIIYRTLDTPTVYKIRLIVSNICGSDTMTKFITVLPNTVKSFFSTSAQNGCQSLTVNFKDLSYGGANISWNFGDGGTSSDSSPVHTFSTPGTYKVRQFVNNNCSYDTSSVMIYVYPKPRFTIGKSAGNICVNQPVQFVSNLQDSGYIVWHFGDEDSSNAYDPTHVYTSTGKKIFTATLTSNFNTCKSVQKDSLIVQAIPIVSIAADTNRACLNRYFNLSAISNGNHYYTWDFGDSNFAITKDVPYKFNKPGTYTIKLVATSILGCKDSAFKQIEVYPIPTALFDYTPKDTCIGPVWVNFTNQSIGANSFAWDFGNGNTSNLTNPRSYYSGIGKYKIQLTAENTYFCYDTITQDFEIFNKPLPDFDFDVNAGCTPLTVNFTNKSKFSKTYLWYFGDSTTSTLENPQHIYYKSGTYNVSLVAFAGQVCSDSIRVNKTIIVHPKPIPSFTHELLTIQKPYRDIVFTSTSINGNKFEWNFGDGKNGTGKITSNKYAEADSGCFTVRLRAMSTNNCDSAITDTVCLPGYWKGLYVPNAFTPNEGIEEVQSFLPAGKELKSYHLKIYTKWGELVWESTELKDGKPAKGWDGNHKDTGNECEQGAYIWTLEAVFTDNKSWDGMLFPGATKHVKYGNVTLIR
jgi:PKD repeat protein